MILDPIKLIRYNANRGRITAVPIEDRNLYLMEFDLVDPEYGAEHYDDVWFEALDDSHASNKANFLLLLGVYRTDITFENLHIYQGDREVQNNGTCTCHDDLVDRFCPLHGAYLIHRGALFVEEICCAPE